jgi:transcriptional regulator with XRE-family HTH domain
MNQELLKQQLVGAFLTAKSQNGRYSKRAYAKKLGISHGPLIDIMKGKRNVSPKMAQKLCERLSLSPKLIGLITSTPKENSMLREEIKNHEFELKEDQFFLISDITHFAFLNFIKIKNESHDFENLAIRLGLTTEKIRLISERLIRLNLISLKNNRYVRTKDAITSSDDVLSLAIKASHQSNLSLAKERLNEIPIELRDFTSIVMPINPKKIAAAKELIRKFQDDLESLLEDSKASEVYAFNTQLIPLSKIKNKGTQNEK